MFPLCPLPFVLSLVSFIFPSQMIFTHIYKIPPELPLLQAEQPQLSTCPHMRSDQVINERVKEQWPQYQPVRYILTDLQLDCVPLFTTLWAHLFSCCLILILLIHSNQFFPWHLYSQLDHRPLDWMDPLRPFLYYSVSN